MKLKILEDMSTLEVALVLYDENPDGRYIYDFKNRTMTKYERGEITDDQKLKIPHSAVLGIYKETKRFIKSGGGSLPTESYQSGKLKATEKHLEDMRTLVFMSKPKKKDPKLISDKEFEEYASQMRKK